MKKIQYLGGFLVATLLLGSAFSAHAQSNNYQYTYNSSNTTCISLTNYLSLGSVDSGNGGQVTMLQQFLNQTGYLNGVSGFYNQGTYGAVVNYQREHGIPQTGTVGPVTRIAINQQSCNGNYSNNNGNTNNGSVSISSLSSTSGVSGSSVTIYGTSLTNSNSVVHFGGSTVSTSYATNNAITFTVPAFSNGTYQIYVTNSYGTSNSLSYTITASNNNNCSYVNGSNQCGCINNQNYSYNYSYNNNGYSNTNCDTNSNTSNWYSGTNGTPKISSVIGLASASTGTSYTWSASAYSQNGLPVTVSVDWADGTSHSSSQSYSNGSQQQSYPFSHVYSNPGMYTIRFTATDSSGAYAYATQLVNVTGNYSTTYNNNNCTYSYNNTCNNNSNYNNNNNNNNNNYSYTYSYTKPAISNLSQMSGTRGTTITINGSNFSPNVTVLFGGASYYTTSFNNGTTITFTIPNYSSGNYVLLVTNANGDNSNGMTFILY
ncbi:MAG: hypothetical protein JWL75_159 [Parcubacteria group bacterium]|nr:hypothetical protein [Parcubacteria group bacterium]